MKAVTISSIRTNMKSYFDEVSLTEDILIVPRNNNEDDAVVVPLLRSTMPLRKRYI